MDLYSWVVNVNRCAKITARIVQSTNFENIQIITNYFSAQNWLGGKKRFIVSL
jgi:hypothetical protein